MVFRIYVEKKTEHAVEALSLNLELTSILGIRGLTQTRIVQRYDIEGIDKELFQRAITVVLSEPPVDDVFYNVPHGDFVFAVEYIPGQFDQRAASAAECIQLISQGERPQVAAAKLYVFDGTLSNEDKAAIEKYLINPVEARRASLDDRETLLDLYQEPSEPEIISGFRELRTEHLSSFIKKYGLAMDKDDLLLCVRYFEKEGRNPSITEIRVLDTYWSDHCRHTTFGTIIDNVEIEDDKVKRSYKNYLDIRKKLNVKKSQTLMDIATIGAKYLKSEGKLYALDEGPENNACSIRITVDNDGKDEEWLLLFKNETHNHPTEIEPFGGAATCIGGAIRDPLSGRAYVYQAMRITGSGDPLTPVSSTLPGKLPQRKIVTSAANGYSSYGNQIGLATSFVEELYHEGYTAKRMEIGAVLGAVPLKNVHRTEPEAGDLVVLLGGRTGRDGCGGATGSSKSHKAGSLHQCGAEIQKGNAPEERKIQRLFRNPKVSAMIKRCNDFGAGGVSVAIGELADGLFINLDAVPKKYDGLDGTELAISESQERMAVVVEEKDAAAFIAAANVENLEAAVVAKVTDDQRLKMKWRGKIIVDIARDFINTNGAEKHIAVKVRGGGEVSPSLRSSASPLPPLLGASPPNPHSTAEKFLQLAGDLNVCGKKGLVERFDSTIGAASVLMPFGGKFQLTPAQVMAAKIPVEGETASCSGFSYGFDPYISECCPYTGSYLAVLISLAKLAAAGFSIEGAYLSFQEYFGKPGGDPERWGLPFSALLGALQAQIDFGTAAIGGKDSMSGTFENMDVPPTLVSFAVAMGKKTNVISPEFKKEDHCVIRLKPAYSVSLLPEQKSFKRLCNFVTELIAEKKAVSVWANSRFGAAEALLKMSFGNRLGLCFDNSFDTEKIAELFECAFGSFIVELNDGLNEKNLIRKTADFDFDIGVIGKTQIDYSFDFKNEKNIFEKIDLEHIQEAWESKMETLFPYRKKNKITTGYTKDTENLINSKNSVHPVSSVVKCSTYPTEPHFTITKNKKPRALITVFPGTNCEYDTERALKRAGAETDIFVVRNLCAKDVAQSAAEVARRITQAQMLILPGGFSGGDEPDGSAKLIASFFRGRQAADAVMELLKKRDGLILGICNGFQALIKLGLVPLGEISGIDEYSPTLTFNAIGRHQSMLVRTRITSTLSPWFLCEELGAVHTIPVSHGEGRFTASAETVKKIAENAQIAAQYVDLTGNAAMDLPYNPNGSIAAIEGITSPDGRVLGKMAHSERAGDDLYKNVPDNKRQKLFEGGVKYFGW